MKGNVNTAGLQSRIAKGWKPNNYLTNMSMAYFQEEGDFVAPSIFPICPVGLSSSYYYTFSKADLARDNVARKPAFGKVQPALMGQTDSTYKCEVDQVIVGVDQIDALNYQRSRAPGVADPRRAKVRFATEQLKLHLDLIFAQNFFTPAAWNNVWTGVPANPNPQLNQFLRFNDANFDREVLKKVTGPEVHHIACSIHSAYRLPPCLLPSCCRACLRRSMPGFG
jgi:hypothetical protein